MNFLPRRPFPEGHFRQAWQFVTMWLFVVVKDAICQGVFDGKNLDFVCRRHRWVLPRRNRKRRASQLRMARRHCC
jgi:hypothetical protein